MRLIFVLAAMVIGLAGCSTNPSTGRSQLILFSYDEVAAMGAQAKPQLVEEFGGEVPSAGLRNYVTQVGLELARRTEPQYAHIQWEFTTLNSNVINAFALPGGRVFITRGLLAMMSNEAQLAAVLGHEIGHVTAKHTDERISQAVLANLGLQVVASSSKEELVVVGAGMLTNVSMLKFSRDHENEADSQGLKYMTAAGYDPQGMIEVMQILASASGGSRSLEWLATHPMPETRRQRVQNLIDQQYAATVGNPSFRKFEDRFAQQARPHLGAAPAGIALPPGACLLCGLVHEEPGAGAEAAGAMPIGPLSRRE